MEELSKNIINPKIVAKNPNLILERAGISCKQDIKLIAYEYKRKDFNNHFIGEKIAPIITFIKSKNFDESLKLAEKVLNYSGKGHSAGIYSKNRTNIIKAGKFLNVSRLIVNQPNSRAAGGSLHNGLMTTLSLGCGSWGNNLSNENLSYLDFLNKTKIVFEINK